MQRGSFALIASMGVVLFAACVGENPDVDRPASDAGTPPPVVPAEGGAPDTGTGLPPDVDPADLDARCPKPATYKGCGTGPSLEGATFHLDACTLGKKEGVLGEWAAVTGQTLTTGPGGGGLYCRGSLEQRPGVVFADGAKGFTLGASAASALDYTTNFVLVAVLRYEPKTGVPGSIVFQRNTENAAMGFPGPQLTANIAYPSSGMFGSYDIDPEASCKGIGMQLQYGPKDRSGGGVSAATDTHRIGPIVVVAKLRSFPPSGAMQPAELELRINGKSEATTLIADLNTLPNGAGEALRIGYTVQEENAFTGVLSEIAFFPDGVPDLPALEDGMLAKWGIPRAP